MVTKVNVKDLIIITNLLNVNPPVKYIQNPFINCNLTTEPKKCIDTNAEK